MNPIARIMDAYQSASFKQQRRYRTITATSMAVVANAGIGSLATDPNSLWYKSLNKPAIQPAPWVFPVVWTPLYASIAYAVGQRLADIEEQQGKSRQFDSLKESLATNIALNAGWSLVFFRGKAPLLATVTAGALAASSADLWRKTDSNILLPYVAWTSFATILSVAIWWKNR